jgi:hypothetical protein
MKLLNVEYWKLRGGSADDGIFHLCGAGGIGILYGIPPRSGSDGHSIRPQDKKLADLLVEDIGFDIDVAGEEQEGIQPRQQLLSRLEGVGLSHKVKEGVRLQLLVSLTD